MSNRITTTHCETLADLLRGTAAAAGLSIREIARRMKTSPAAVSRMISGKASPTWGTIERFCDAVGYDLTLQLMREEKVNKGIAR